MKENKNSYKLYGSNLKKPLTPEEQAKYLELASQGNYEAQQKLFEHSLRFVGYVISKQYKNIMIDKDELFQMGSIGLWKAIQNFDLSYGTNFFNYAIANIEGEIKSYLSKNATILKVPRSIKNLAYKIVKLKQKYAQQGIILDTKQIANLLEVTEKEITEALGTYAKTISLYSDDHQNPDGIKKDIESALEDTTVDVEKNLIDAELSTKIKDTIDKLTNIEREVIKRLFGFDCQRQTQKEIADELGLSQHEISKIQKRAIQELKFLLPKSISDEAQKERKSPQLLIDKDEQITKELLCTFPYYTEQEILKAIDMLKENDKRIIELKFGLNGNKITSTKEIAQILNSNTENTSCKIWSIKTKIKQIMDQNKCRENEKCTNPFFELFPGYSKEQILQAVNKLKEEYEESVELEINLTENEVLSNQEKQNRKELLYMFPYYTEQEILEAIDMLKESDKKIIELRYGLNGNEITSSKLIAELLNTDTQSISCKLWKLKTKIKQIMDHNKSKQSEIYENQFFELFKGYSREQILQALSKLKPENKIIIELKYGLNGNDVTQNQNIKETLSLPTDRVNARIYDIKLQILNKLKIKEPKVSKRESIFNWFPNYSEEQILGAISALSKTNRKIIELYYGLNGQEITNAKEIISQLNLKCKKIEHQIYLIKKQIAENLEAGITKRESIFDLYPEYTEEQILNVINSLSEINRNIIELKYGLNGKEVLSNQEIKERLNLDSNTLSIKFYAAKNQIQKKLEKSQIKILNKQLN